MENPTTYHALATRLHTLLEEESYSKTTMKDMEFMGRKSRCTGRYAAYYQKPAGFSLRSDNNTGHESALPQEKKSIPDFLW